MRSARSSIRTRHCPESANSCRRSWRSTRKLKSTWRAFTKYKKDDRCKYSSSILPHPSPQRAHPQVLILFTVSLNSLSLPIAFFSFLTVWNLQPSRCACAFFLGFHLYHCVNRGKQEFPPATTTTTTTTIIHHLTFFLQQEKWGRGWWIKLWARI